MNGGKNLKKETNVIACASRLNNDYQQSIFYVSVSEEEARFKTPQRLLLSLWCVSQVKFDLINNEIGFQTNIWGMKKYWNDKNLEAHSHVFMHTHMHTSFWTLSFGETCALSLSVYFLFFFLLSNCNNDSCIWTIKQEEWEKTKRALWRQED